MITQIQRAKHELEQKLVIKDLKNLIKDPGGYSNNIKLTIISAALLLLLTSCATIPQADCPYPCPTLISNQPPEQQLLWFHEQQAKTIRDMKRKGQWRTEPSTTLTVIQETP